MIEYRLKRIFFFVLFSLAWSSLLFSQVQPDVIDLGVINGEQKVVQRSFAIKYDQLPQELRVNNDALSIEERKLDTLSQNMMLKLKLNVDSRLGRFIDTLFLVSQDEFVQAKYLLEYQILTPVGDVFKSYRNEFWPFRSKEQVFNLKIGRAGDTLKANVDLLNFSGTTLHLSNIEISDSLQVSFEPEKVPHNSFTRMSLSYMSKAHSSLGFQRYSVLLKQGIDSLVYLPLQHSLLPSTTKEGPILGLTRNELDYKVVKEGDLISDVILITNNGTETLEIYTVESNCICLEASISKRKILPQQNAQLRFKFDTKNREGLERKMITIFTNDPSLPAKSIIVKAHVK